MYTVQPAGEIPVQGFDGEAELMAPPLLEGMRKYDTVCTEAQLIFNP